MIEGIYLDPNSYLSRLPQEALHLDILNERVAAKQTENVSTFTKLVRRGHTKKGSGRNFGSLLLDNTQRRKQRIIVGGTDFYVLG